MRAISAKRLTHTGSTLRPRTPEQKAIIARELEAKVWPLLDKGAFRPVIDATYPLAEAAKAHAHMEASTHVGKIVLTL
jgi:NADPH2:quinone reductase